MTMFQESLNQLKSELLKQQPVVGKEYDVVATHVIDVNNFYIVPLSCYRLVNILEKPGASYNEDLTACSTVIYMSPTLRQLVRGTVCSSHNNSNIFAMDYGFTDESVPYQDIYSLLNDELKNIPGLARLCGLSMCYPRHQVFSATAINDFKFFMGQKGERLTVTIKENTGNKLGVLVMSSETNPDDVSTCMAYASHSALYAI